MSARIRILIVLLLILTACDRISIDLTPTQNGYAVLDPLFREFYNFLGGQPVLGPVISNVKLQGDTRIQYTENALMIYIPNEQKSQKFQLAPLGVRMGISDAPVPKPDDPRAVYINGHVVYPDFVPFFENLKGTRFLGRPLTEARHNPDQKRIEQYFENAGLYRMDGESSDKVHLLAYGAWVCSIDCRAQPPQSSKVDLYLLVDPLFENFARSLGVGLTGFSISKAYVAADGWKEQIFENVVIGINPSDPTNIQLRPITEKLQITPDLLVKKSSAPDLVFYPVLGDKGYNVPLYFKDYLDLHGGYQISGAPITSLSEKSAQTYRQCFINLCLIYEELAAGSWHVRPEALGRSYKSLFYSEGSVINPVDRQGKQINISIWEDKFIVGSYQGQVIGATALDNNQPVEGINLDLTLMLGQDIQQTMFFPPTGKDGKTQLRLPTIIGPNGTIIPYQVCVHNSNPPVCTRNRFIIWNNP